MNLTKEQQEFKDRIEILNRFDVRAFMKKMGAEYSNTHQRRVCVVAMHKEIAKNRIFKVQQRVYSAQWLEDKGLTHELMK